MKKPVCEGDPTTHGGVVRKATSTFRIDGRLVALRYDIVSYPEHGDNPIIEDGDGYKEGGRKWVVDGCATQCGSRVIGRTEGMTIR